MIKWPSIGLRNNLVFAVLAAATVWLFATNVARLYFLGDDAFISFRYSANLVDGMGLVWNAGEHVEGYTNFLWVLLMAAGLAVGVAPEIGSNVLGIAAGAGVLLLVWRASVRGGRLLDPWALMAPLALAACDSFAAWCTGGLETMLFTLLVLAGCLRFLRERDAQSNTPLGSALLLAAASLTRPEGALFTFVIGLFYLTDIVRRRCRLRPALIWGAVYLAIAGGHLLWRHSYYGFWLPNTFYAKVPGAWWDRGFEYLWLFHRVYDFGWFVPLTLFAWLGGRSRKAALFVAVTTAYLTYVAYVGGDRFEFRFIVPVLPYLCWLVVEGARQLVERAPTGWRTPVSIIGALVIAAFSLATWRGSLDRIDKDDRHGVTSTTVIDKYREFRAQQGLALREMIDDGSLPADLVLCCGGVGALPYYTRWPTVDRRGLNDVEIARQPVPERGWIGHERDATVEYLQRRGVVVFDVLNRLLIEDRPTLGRRWAKFGEGRVPLHLVRIGNHNLMFATFASDEELRRTFAKGNVIR